MIRKNFYLEQSERVDHLILAAMLNLAAYDTPATAKKIAGAVANTGYWATPSSMRYALGRLVRNAMVVEWGPVGRPAGTRGRNPSTWQLTAEGELIAQEQDLP